MMDRQSPDKTEGGGERETNGTAATVTVTSNTKAITAVANNNAMTTTASTTPPRSQAPPTSLGTAPIESQAVQPIHSRSQTMAAQYLQQMYAAQQQHIILQTAALQQQQPPSNRQSPSLPPAANTTVPQSTGTSITLPASPVTGQLIGCSQSSSSTTGTITQQAMLLGNCSASCNQAQMYLRTQMLILTPAVTVAAVQSDLPSVCCSSSQLSASQVHSLAVQAHLPGALATAQSVLLKPFSTQPQTLVSSLPKMSICPLRSSQQYDPSTETSGAEPRLADVTRLTSANQLIAPASYTPVQSHAVVRHQLHCPPSHKGAPHQHQHQLIIQQTIAGSHRQLHPIALRLAPQDTSPSLFPLTLQPLATPTHTTTTVQSQPGDGLPVLSSSCEPPTPPPTQQTVVVSSSSAPPPLLCPSLLQPQPQLHRQPQLQPPTLRLGPISQASLPRLLQSPPASLQRLSLRTVQALAVQSTGVLVSEELPVAEALVQMPFQNHHPPQTFQNLSQTFQNPPQTFHNLSPPQTVAVDLKVKPATLRTQNPEERTEEMREEMREERTTPPPTLSPSAGSDRLCKDIQPAHTENCTGRLDFPCVPPSSRSVIHSSQDSSSYTSCSPPPLLPSAAVRSPGQSPSASATLPGSPERARPLILTHIIEGFVVREALQPFLPVPFPVSFIPMGRSSLGADQQATLPEAREVRTNGDPTPEMRSNKDSAPEMRTNGDRVSEMRTNGGLGPEESLMDAEQPDNDSDMDDTPTQDEPTAESLVDVLQCEFCGKRGYVHTFLRSKRFCSMTCVRRFNVSCTKRLSVLKVDKASRWGHRPMGRRGRPPGRVNGGTREHFLLRQVQGPYGSEETQRTLRGEGEEEDEPPVPMITRLRRQEEREREREQGRQRKDTFISSGEQTAGGRQECSDNPTQWSVEQVCSYINSLPGGRDISEEFRSHEIDGQALLLLTEDHLMTAMNIKLGPALKLCAHINSLKEP
ncbi:polyhomeotic-like protein 3 isoform X1 [Coregonus clupeaformis]|uniref:polyhomeotic-like protein 3 isoform X1 n=1 Tax=Coregonus clupeaformis TaxID=59861 RepID=UPI001BE02AFE|nr:polyhomeotic-like protein 3 isoform X1 [Coregonus clupeaformis]XP_041752726.1 polyhomeotic-like protein 3 isoform X1 [Coregonus clupeaformis]